MYRVLVVDDEKLEREGIRFLLSMEEGEWEIYEAANGKLALNELRKHPVDLMLTDIKMPSTLELQQISIFSFSLSRDSSEDKIKTLKPAFASVFEIPSITAGIKKRDICGMMRPIVFDDLFLKLTAKSFGR